jgi:Tfp pilus assembly protein PilF
MDRKEGAADFNMGPVWGRMLKVTLGAGLIAWLAFLPGCISQSSASRRALQQIRPANNTAQLVRNATYLKKVGRVELAVEDLEEAHLQEPDNLEILDALTRSYEDLGDFDRAQELYEEALSRGGRNPALENNRCYSLYLQGRLGQAEACFRKVLARQPDNKAARNNLGLVLCRQGREAEALAMWRGALSDAEARQHLGQALAALGKEVPPSLAAPPPAPAVVQVAAVGAPAAAPAPTGLKQPSSPTTQAASTPSTPLAAFFPATPAPSAAQTSPTATASAPDVRPAQPFTSGPSPARVASSPPEAVAAAAVAPVPKPASAAPAATTVVKKPRVPVLTAQDLEETRIEVKNGNGIQHQARETRSLLALEGFNVVSIGNHIDFGLKDTVIAYRPESVKVARTLVRKFFPSARLEEGGKLSAGADIRISLGRDQIFCQGDMAKKKWSNPNLSHFSSQPALFDAIQWCGIAMDNSLI